MFKLNTSFLVLYTTSVEMTHTFYQKLGAEIVEVKSDKVVVRIDTHEMHFILNTSEPFEEYEYIAKNVDFGNGVIFYTEVESIENFYNLLVDAGASIKSEIFDNRWGARELLFEDPNGFKFAVYQMVSN